MKQTPNQAFEHVKESLAQYLETQYKISHLEVFNERARILRERGTIAQGPFIEATPGFLSRHKLAELERVYPKILPDGLSELMLHGVPVDRFPLYIHQEEALLSAFSEKPNLLVATGTGSGKTEAFLLPILSDILKEAKNWSAPSGPSSRGEYDAQHDIWLNSRRHETRPAAVRAIILYPMNALVNDQLMRLRRILARDDSPDWQRSNLNGNVIHFGMYTSFTPVAGLWNEKWRRDKWDKYLSEIEKEWHKLPDKLRETGGWPRPDSPEMLSRWDMQATPPDILVTNYSMLEYMLVRPIENAVFEQTREWLTNTPEAKFTLVLDEAHTYTGAKGTEVAHLVRRLKERLGLQSGAEKFRAIATTASVPQESDPELRQFVSDLFGEPINRFTLIRVAEGKESVHLNINEKVLRAYGNFQDYFSLGDPWSAIKELARELSLGQVDTTVEPEVALYRLVKSQAIITWIRQKTARKAIQLTQLADECWGQLGSVEEREKATAGVLAAGSFARADALKDTPPLLSMRVHAFFRGIPGIWACMDPNCSIAQSNGGRPVGKLYPDPRPWCECGARVLEVFSCRHCGLLFLGGIPDDIHGSLWPWSDDLTGGRQDLKNYRVFAVEAPDVYTNPDFRSSRTTLPIHQNDIYARPVFEIEGAKKEGVEISPYPQLCPRCRKYRSLEINGREVIEPLRTKGVQPFAVVVEEAFRNQPRLNQFHPNYGRKALLFSDSRRDAAMLAASLKQNHQADVFRQLLFRLLYTCPTCKGAGQVERLEAFKIGRPEKRINAECKECGGTGKSLSPEPKSYEELQEEMIDLQLERAINPTGEEMQDFFAKSELQDDTCYEEAKKHFSIALLREVTEEQFSLEPLGLAKWRMRLPDSIGNFDELSEEESKLLIQLITRLLATEDVVTAPEPLKPWNWDRNLVKPYERNVLIRASGGMDRGEQGKVIAYNLTPRRKLGRYVVALSSKLVKLGRLQGERHAEKWRSKLEGELWSALKQLRILEPAGRKISERGDKVPYGIRLNRFNLHPVGEIVSRCSACRYIMADTLLSVCIRCGQETEETNVKDITNFFRRTAEHADVDNIYDDPFPLRASEHTAQVATKEARDEERWFQDLFHEDQNRHDCRVDILSVTTTMEMGIDIGSLLFVGLRNVPPTVANYQQRAGRAGRRGSALATVFTIAQPRSHDQYYFDRPKEIVSDPPRVPSLHVENEVIARRHVRSLVLQSFFFKNQASQRADLFSGWGTIHDFSTRQTAVKLHEYLVRNRGPLIERCKKIVQTIFYPVLNTWIEQIATEIQQVVNRYLPKDELFENLLRSGLLPKYAFPIDVVTLTIPSDNRWWEDYENESMDTLQRDLKIAIAEYAPGAEVVRQSNQRTYKYQSVGIHDPYERFPNYEPTGTMVECRDCQSVSTFRNDEKPAEYCYICNSLNLEILPYLRPRGFTVDGALNEGGREVFVSAEGIERSGTASPARLLKGEASLAVGRPRVADRLYSYIRVGELVICNKGPDKKFPGYLICKDCGRALNPDDPKEHRRPADVPPHQGRNLGPRRGKVCESKPPYNNQVILAHSFTSEIFLLGVNLPERLNSPFTEPSGLAVWYSFGTLIANAAVNVLQIDPGELKVGARALFRDVRRIHGEVFIYDDVPGGAGYARAIDRKLDEVLEKALDLGSRCSNISCPGACYQCLYDYRNQALHQFLDRSLGVDVLRFILFNEYPKLSEEKIRNCGLALSNYARMSWQIEDGIHLDGVYFPVILKDRRGGKVGLWVIHPMDKRPQPEIKQKILANYGIQCAVHTSFDLERRPLWALKNLVHS